MGEADNVRAVERLVTGLNAKDVDVMNEVIVDDSILSWPQSGEIARETAYWAQPFPAPEWRAKWVERA